MSQHDYPTMPNPALQPRRSNAQDRIVSPVPQSHTPGQPVHPSAVPVPRRVRSHMPPPGQRRRRGKISRWILLIPVLGLMFLGLLVLMGLVGLRLAYADSILPHVEVAGIPVGDLSTAEAAQRLEQEWGTIILREGDRTWEMDAASLGLTLQTQQTAERAFAQGHGEGGMKALFATVNVPPVVRLSEKTLRQEVALLAEAQINTQPINAGVDFANGEVVATPAQNGRAVDLDATINALYNNPFALADNTLSLVMRDVAPEITDATPIVNEARRLLSNPLEIELYDPVTGENFYWEIAPAEWAQWLSASSDPNSPIGLSLQAEPALVEAALTQKAASELGQRGIDVEEAVSALQAGLAAGEPQAVTLVVTYPERVHTVRSGETITSIAWDYGVPYPFIQQLNGGIDSISVGQEIRIPAADAFFEFPVVPNKRIVVDISEQRTRVYENGQLKWDWASSTGIDSSPTWTGIYQILSHEPNAYAGNWNLYMPNFLGVYRPVPGSDFTNGFHGFPTRGGGQLLWENSLGTRVTYGCILLSDTNARLLYDWAEEGVVVEIRP